MAFVIGHVVLALSAASPSDGDGIMWSRFYVNLRAAVPGVSVMDHTGGAPTLRWGYATLTSHAPPCRQRTSVRALSDVAVRPNVLRCTTNTKSSTQSHD